MGAAAEKTTDAMTKKGRQIFFQEKIGWHPSVAAPNDTNPSGASGPRCSSDRVWNALSPRMLTVRPPIALRTPYNAAYMAQHRRSSYAALCYMYTWFYLHDSNGQATFSFRELGMFIMFCLRAAWY